MTGDFKRETESSYKLKQEKDPTWVTNVYYRDEFHPLNLLRQVLAEYFHLRFEPIATDPTGQIKEEMSELHIDDPEEKKKYQAIFDALRDEFPITKFIATYAGNLTEEEVGELKEVLGETKAKALLALSYQKKAKVERELRVSDGTKWEVLAKSLAVEPYSPQEMRDTFKEMVGQALGEHPEWRP